MFIIGPLWVWQSGVVNLHLDWRTASRSSAHLAPDPAITKDAVIQVYSARAFHWRGLFSVHTWIATKDKNANQYIVYQVTGWRFFRGLAALTHEADIPDREWFAQKPKIILDIRGQEAEQLIPAIQQAVKNYPEPNTYLIWPGPNSNTFTAFVGRQVPALHLIMPSTAIGKDYLFANQVVAKTPSGTGYQLSLFGVLGVTLALYEGLEVNLLGLVFGISPSQLAIKIPGIGEIGWRIFPVAAQQS